MPQTEASPRRCNENTPLTGAPPGKSINLLKWPEKFQPEETHVPGRFLAEDPCGNGRSLVRYEA